jgi:UPF0755 protein
MIRRIRLLIALGLLIAALVPAVRWALFLHRPVLREPGITVVVPPGAAFGSVAVQLEQSGIVSSAAGFKTLARLRGVTGKIQAGEYLFQKPAPPGRVLDRLLAGDIIRLQLTVPEGFSLREIAARLTSAEFVDTAAFLPLATDPEYIRTLGINADSLEGYLFPETYTFGSRTTSRELLRAMVAQFKKRTPADLLQQAKKHGLNRHQLVTLASIIQKEAGSNEEMPLISAVFHNRLKKGMPLQADPTVIYGIEEFDGNLTRRHLLEPTPYNTYRMTGLPPGPIANPGSEALQAAADPAPVDYLYFVARGDGSHQFSSTLAEHNAAVRHFQLKR